MNTATRALGIGLLALASLSTTAWADGPASPIEGAWRQVKVRNGDATEYSESPDGAEMTDYIVGGRFAWTLVRDGKVLGTAGGRYKFEKGRFTEVLEFGAGGANIEAFVGQTFEFDVKVDGDRFTKVGKIKVGGQDYKIDEVWERCKP